MANLYSLTYVSKTGLKKIIPFSYEKGVVRDKLALTTIDVYTSQFSSDESLLYDLNEKGYNLEEGSFQIDYKNKGKTKKLDVVYSDIERLKVFASKSIDKYIVSQDVDFVRYFLFIVELFKQEPKLIDYLKNYHYITEKFVINVKEFILFSDIGNLEGIFDSRARIKRDLSRYKNIRDIEVGISKYKKRGEITVETSSITKKKTLNKPEQLRLF